MKQIAVATPPRGGVRAKPKAAMSGGVGRVILVVLLLASSAYLGFGGKLEASSALAPESSVAWFAAKPADGGDARRYEFASSAVIRCDKEALAAANRIHAERDRGRQWRRERLLAFRSCLDAWPRSTQQPHL